MESAEYPLTENLDEKLIADIVFYYVRSQDKVFAVPELLENILRYLYPREQLRCRGVNYMWKNAAERLLEKYSLDLDFTYLNEIDHPEGLPKELAHVALLEKHVIGTWFRNTNKIEEFLEEKNLSDSPFPNRTVILFMEHNSENYVEEIEANLLQFVSKFGDQIWHCFVVLNDILSIKRIYSFVEKLLLLKNLKFLKIFTSWWPRLFNFKRFEKLPRLEHLTHFQMGGFRLETCFNNVFLKHGSIDTVQVLHLNGMVSDPFDCAKRFKNLKKLVVHQIRELPFIPSADSFGKLEELDVTFDITRSVPSDIIQVLRWVDICHSKTLRSISFGEGLYRKLKRIDCLETYQVKYPNLKKVSMTFPLLRDASGVIRLLSEKLPTWEEIQLKDFPSNQVEFLQRIQFGFDRVQYADEEEDHYHERIENPRGTLFEQLCRDLWPELPRSVLRISTDSGDSATRL